MAVVDEAVAIAMQNIDISGYGSRVALCLPGTTDCAARRFYFSNSPDNQLLGLHLRDLAAWKRPSFARLIGPKQRAQGMPGARCARSLACKNKKAHEVVTTGSPEQPGIPRAMVLTVSFALSPVTGLYCHCRRQVTTCQLDASVGASEPHDFTVRISRFRQACFSVHRIPCPTSV